jgi:hypothetical protein
MPTDLDSVIQELKDRAQFDGTAEFLLERLRATLTTLFNDEPMSAAWGFWSMRQCLLAPKPWEKPAEIPTSAPILTCPHCGKDITLSS